jgi:hypothetical protein
MKRKVLFYKLFLVVAILSGRYNECPKPEAVLFPRINGPAPQVNGLLKK